jgi:hypothetical protein
MPPAHLSGSAQNVGERHRDNLLLHTPDTELAGPLSTASQTPSTRRAGAKMHLPQLHRAWSQCHLPTQNPDPGGGIITFGMISEGHSRYSRAQAHCVRHSRHSTSMALSIGAQRKGVVYRPPTMVGDHADCWITWCIEELHSCP